MPPPLGPTPPAGLAPPTWQPPNLPLGPGSPGWNPPSSPGYGTTASVTPPGASLSQSAAWGGGGFGAASSPPPSGPTTGPAALAPVQPQQPTPAQWDQLRLGTGNTDNQTNVDGDGASAPSAGPTWAGDLYRWSERPIGQIPAPSAGIGRHVRGTGGLPTNPLSNLRGADIDVTPQDVAGLYLGASRSLNSAGQALNATRAATQAAAPAAVQGAARAPAVAATTRPLWRRAIDFGSRNDYYTGVVGPARNIGSAVTNLAQGNYGAAANAALIRTPLTLSAPAIASGLDESINRPGTIDTDRAARRTADSTERLREVPDLANEGFARRELGRARNYARMLPGSFDNDPTTPSVQDFVGGNFNTLGRIAGALTRNPEGVVGQIGRGVGNLADAARSGDPNAPSMGDQYQTLNREYADLVNRYQEALQAGDPNALANFRTGARALAPMFRELDYSAPSGAGLSTARQQFLQQQGIDRVRGEYGDRSAEIDQIRGTLEDHTLYRPPGGRFDPTRMSSPLPTGRDIGDAMRHYGHGTPAPPADGFMGRMGAALQQGVGGTVPQSPGAAAVASQRLDRDLAPILGSLRTNLSGTAQPAAEADRQPVLGAAPPAAPAPGAPNPADVMANAPPQVQQELAAIGPQIGERLNQLGINPEELAAGGAVGAAGALAAIQNAPPPPNSPGPLREYWDKLPDASRFLAIAGLSLTAISFLRSAFGGGDDEDDEPGFLMKVLPFLGIGAAAWGLGGGTLWGPNGVSMPQMAQYRQLGEAVKANLPSLSLGAASR